MQSTKNYGLVKQELTDVPDITQIAGNWDKIDAEMKRLEDDKFNKAGGSISGDVTIKKVKVTENAVSSTVSDNEVQINGGKAVGDGASFVAYGKAGTNKGAFLARATDGTNTTDLLGSAGGALTWGNKNVPFAINGATADEKGVVTIRNFQNSFTIGGQIVSKGSNNPFVLQSKEIVKGTAPSTRKFLHIPFYDKNGTNNNTNRLGKVEYLLDTNGAVQMFFGVSNPKNLTEEELNGLVVRWDENGKPYVGLMHQPEKSSNDATVATTRWVKSQIATPTEYGLVKVATEEAVLQPLEDVAVTPKILHDVMDMRHENTAYKVGDVVECGFNHELRLECIQAGTTSANPLDTRNAKHGQELTDGSVKWRVATHILTVNGKTPDAKGNIQIDGFSRDDVKRMVLDIFFPVGSIYMDATGKVNPNTQFGGSWSKIESRFLLGSSSTYPVGSIGGEANVTLTLNQIPSHNHARGGMNIVGASTTTTIFNNTRNQGGENGAIEMVQNSVINLSSGGGQQGLYGLNFNASRNWPGSTSLQGGGASHNNMPPYIAVNVWKRTA